MYPEAVSRKQKLTLDQNILEKYFPGQNSTEVPAMDRNKILEVLKCSRVFSGLPGEELNRLVHLGRFKSIPKGRYIVRERQRARHFFVVLSGKVQVIMQASRARHFTIDVYKAGEAFISSPLFNASPYYGSAIAMEDTILFVINRTKFLRFLRQNPQIIIQLIIYYSEGIHMITTRIRDNLTASVEQRLLYALLLLHSKFGPVIEMPAREIATLACTTTETTLRLLNRLKDRGIISTSRGKIVIQNIKRLNEYYIG